MVRQSAGRPTNCCFIFGKGSRIFSHPKSPDLLWPPPMMITGFSSQANKATGWWSFLFNTTQLWNLPPLPYTSWRHGDALCLY